MSPLSVIIVYLAWVAATYLLEGLPQTLLRPEAAGMRFVYAVVANLIVGLGGSGVILTRLSRRYGVPAATAGFRTGRRTLLSIVAAAALGTGAYAAQSPPPRPLAVLINGFSQVLAVSAAEVIVCWALTTAAIAAARPSISAGRARALAIVPASVLFGVYHVGHSAPFNTPGMIVPLTGVGLLTGIFHLCTGEVIGTLVFHNFLALFGVLGALDRSGGTASYHHVQPPLVLTAAAALTVIVTVARALVRLERSGARAAGIRRRRA
jgi:hypothetical protein